MGIVVSREEYSPLAYLLTEYYRPRGPRIGTKREQDYDDAKFFGTKMGIAKGIAAILTQEKLDLYPLMKWVDLIMEYEVTKILDEFSSEFPLSKWTDETQEEFEQRKANLWASIESGLKDLALGSEITRDSYAKVRREKIVSGELDPGEATDEDREYWRKEYEKSKSDMATFAKLAAPYGVEDD